MLIFNLGKEIESRWKNVRDGLCRYRRKVRSKSGVGEKTVKEYKYAQLLGFLVPFLPDRSTEGISESNDYDDEETQHHANLTRTMI